MEKQINELLSDWSILVRTKPSGSWTENRRTEEAGDFRMGWGNQWRSSLWAIRHIPSYFTYPFYFHFSDKETEAQRD